MNLKGINPNTMGKRPGLNFYPKKGILLIGVKLIILGLLLSVNQWGPETAKASETLEEKGVSEPMEMSQMNTVTSERIPPIDASAPKTTETATFAMG
jgi:hypothetical protein